MYRDGRLEEEKKSISLFGSFIYLLWRLFSIVGRCLALILFAMAFHYWIGVVVLIHFVLSLLIVIYVEKERYNECWEVVMMIIGCFMSLFASFHIWTGRTRRFYITGYLVEFIGNTVMLFLCWYNFLFPFTLYVCLASLVASIVGIGFMLCYYNCFHPNKCVQDTASNLGDIHDVDPASSHPLTTAL